MVLKADRISDQKDGGNVPPGMTPAILPSVLRDIAEIAGMGAAIDLCDAMGGRGLYIPKGAAPAKTDQLARAVGIVAAKKIMKAMGGEYLRIPTARPVLRAYRVRILRKANYSTAQIAMMMVMDRSHVSRLAPASEYPPEEVPQRLLVSVLRTVPAQFSRLKPAGQFPRTYAADEMP